MKDDIYSLSGLLNSNGSTGAKDKVAIILTADSCKEAILSAIRDGERTHTACNCTSSRTVAVSSFMIISA